MQSNMLDLWVMYHDIPGWLQICRLLGVGESGIAELEAIDEFMIIIGGCEQEYKRDVQPDIRALKDGIKKEWADERRLEYLKDKSNAVMFELQSLYDEYAQSRDNDEPYVERAILKTRINDVEKVLQKIRAEVKARQGIDKGKITDEQIQAARERNFTDFIELDRGKASCPFHNERTPSFSVKDNRGYCFGCNWHGDVIDFIQQKNGMTFVNAVKYLTGGYHD